MTISHGARLPWLKPCFQLAVDVEVSAAERTLIHAMNQFMRANEIIFDPAATDAEIRALLTGRLDTMQTNEFLGMICRLKQLRMAREQ